MAGYQLGDYVIADKALYDTFHGQTFRILSFGSNLFSAALIRVQDIQTGNKTSFYPCEISWEDGTSP